MANIEVLMSAMHQTDLSLAEKSNVQSDTLIINQCDRNGYDEITYRGHKIRMISTTERGASKSRNMAMDNAVGDICIMADDDEVFSDGYPQAVLAAYEEKPDADMIAFNVSQKNDRMKTKTISEFRKSPRMQSYGTWSITFRRESVIKRGVRFNEKFGPGSGGIAMSEDSLWCRYAVKSGMKIYQHPYYLCEIGQTESTWFQGFGEHFFYDRGAYLLAAMPKTCRLFKYYYIYNSRHDNELSIPQKLKWMNAGIKGFKKGLSYDEYRKTRK